MAAHVICATREIDQSKLSKHIMPHAVMTCRMQDYQSCSAGAAKAHLKGTGHGLKICDKTT